MTTPQIVMPEMGAHNADYGAAVERLQKARTYEDCSTVILIPTRGGRSLIPRVVASWFSLMPIMNQKRYGPWFLTGMEVGEAYSQGFQAVLSHPELALWKYVLTIEDDNMPPPDGHLKLIEAIEGQVDGTKYDVVGGIYWTKGEQGQPMCYGHPDVLPANYIPWLPPENTVARTRGLGMGFNLWRIETLRRHPDLWKFRTVQSHDPSGGTRVYTQDLDWYERASKVGALFACDTRVRVGHYDVENDRVW